MPAKKKAKKKAGWKRRTAIAVVAAGIGTASVAGCVIRGGGSRFQKPRIVPATRRGLVYRPPGRTTSLALVQWPKIFEIYPRWKPDSPKGWAARDLITGVRRQVGVSPAEVLHVMEEHYLNKYAFARLNKVGKLSAKNAKIFKALLDAEKVDRQAFLYVHRLTTRTWGSKKKIRALLNLEK